MAKIGPSLAFDSETKRDCSSRSYTRNSTRKREKSPGIAVASRVYRGVFFRCRAGGTKGKGSSLPSSRKTRRAVLKVPSPPIRFSYTPRDAPKGFLFPGYAGGPPAHRLFHALLRRMRPEYATPWQRPRNPLRCWYFASDRSAFQRNRRSRGTHARNQIHAFRWTARLPTADEGRNHKQMLRWRRHVGEFALSCAITLNLVCFSYPLCRCVQVHKVAQYC